MTVKNPLTFPILTTERLTLRQLSENDVEEIFLLRSDIVVNKYLNRAPCNTLEEALIFIRGIRNNGLLYWLITRSNNEQFLGTICLFDFSEEQNKCEIGYELLAVHQRTGIMNEAAKKVIEYASKKLKVRIIDAHVDRENVSSIKLLRRLNFETMPNADPGEPSMILFRFKCSK
ncbi:ribosomal-protein-alanine N-acetyltransferase [Pedobacter sp. UYEF25]